MDSQRSSRRRFLRTAGLAGVGLWAADRSWAQADSPNERVDFACIGVGGKGDSDTADAARFGNVVAICDVDENTLAEAAKKYPNARRYTDYRRMLDEVGKQIDAVTVSTPDHTHAPAAAMAMRMGKHCFCQKPLTRSISEARALGRIAREMKVATQMGNQGTADSGLRRNAARVRAGALGTVREIHVWTNRPIWPQGMDRPAAAPVPMNLNWLSWVGPAPMRRYGNGYHSFNWRGWWDFGTGALGDMACHTVNMPYMALDLRNPTSVVAQTSGHNRDSYPKWSVIRFEFPQNGKRAPLTLHWYDGGKRPSQDLLPGETFEDSGSLLIGDKGKLYIPGDYGGGGKFIDAVDVGDVSFPESPGHFEEFIRAIKTGQPAMSNFPDYAGPLTETVLLGNLAVWADGKKIEWDAANMRATNAAEVHEIIYPRYRAGYSL
jgi:predicted dehydrogenase